MTRWIRWTLPAFVLVSGMVSALPGAFPGRADAADEPLAKVTFDEHIRPIFREYCFSCHNQDRATSGVALDTYAAVMEGGAGGEIVVAQDVDGSRLYDLITHRDEPRMPPSGQKMPEEKLALVKAWIEGGCLENPGSKVVAKKKPTLDLAVAGTTGKPEGPAAMPEGVLRQPVRYTDRAAAVTALAASPWAPLVAVAGQEQVSLYHSDSGELLGVLPFLGGVPHVLRFSRNGELLLAAGGRAASSGWATLYEVRSGRLITQVGDELDAALAADINNAHTRVALGGPLRVVRVYDTASGEVVYEIRKHTDWVLALEFSPDGVLLATADRAGGLFVWEAATGREFLNLTGHRQAITGVSWRGDSNLLASASEDGTVMLWDVVEGKSVRTIRHGAGVQSVAFTHDGRLLTAGRDRQLKAWQSDGTAVRAFPALADVALRGVFTHDGERVVGGDWTGDVRVWETATGQEAARLPANPPTLEMRLAEMEKLLADALAEAEPLRAAHAAAQEQAAALAATLAQAEAEHTAAQESMRQAEAALASSDAEIAAANDALTAAQQTAADAEAALRQAEAARAEAEKSLAAEDTPPNQEALKARQTDAEQAAAALAEASAMLEQARRQLAEKQQQRTARQNALAHATERLESLAASVQQRSQEKAEADQKATEMQETAGKALARTGDLQGKVNALRDEIAAFREIPERLASAAKAAEGELAPIVEQLAAAQASYAEAERLVAERDAAARQLKAQLDQLRAEYEKLLDAKLAAQRQQADAGARLEEAEESAAELRARFENASGALERFHQAYGIK